MTAYATTPSMILNFATDRRGYAQTALTVTLASLPSTDPHVAGQVWNDNGTPTVSSG